MLRFRFLAVCGSLVGVSALFGAGSASAAGPAVALSGEPMLAAALARPVSAVVSVALAGRPASSGVMDALPDAPSRHSPEADFGSRRHHFQTRVAEPTPVPIMPNAPASTPLRAPAFGMPVSTLDSVPLLGAARHTGAAQRINTDDGSTGNFAICYRLSRRTGFQVIPGDTTPSTAKLPVSTVRNNAGVMVGMVLRLTLPQVR